MNNVPRFRGCVIFRTRVIRQKVSLSNTLLDEILYILLAFFSLHDCCLFIL